MITYAIGRVQVSLAVNKAQGVLIYAHKDDRFYGSLPLDAPVEELVNKIEALAEEMKL